MTGPRRSKLSQLSIFGMACVRNGGPGADCPDRAFSSCAATLLARVSGVELVHHDGCRGQARAGRRHHEPGR